MEKSELKNENKALARFIDKCHACFKYCTSGVWTDPKQTLTVRIVKTLNLSINSFLNRGLQIRSMALTYSTVLALVPTIALLIAIGRGFGLQDYLQIQLYNAFPAQEKAISTALDFVDSYLAEASGGLFVGIGIILLLWTVISLLSHIETAFNSIWDRKVTRSFYQKITDYIAICLLIPILMICSSGVSIFMSTTIQENLQFSFLTPLINVILEAAPVFLVWIAFTLSFFLIPNTKVRLKYAAISGFISAIGFQILQMLFVNGQIYVSKYNAIYGSFAFLPLLLIWLQLSWLLLLSGCVLTYSLQNVFTFSSLGNNDLISIKKYHAISLITMCIIVKRFLNSYQPLSPREIALNYNLPIRIVNRIVEKLEESKLVYIVKLGNDHTGITPATDVTTLALGNFLETIDSCGDNNIVPKFDIVYKDLLELILPIAERSYSNFDSILIKDIPIPSPDQISTILRTPASQE